MSHLPKAEQYRNRANCMNLIQSAAEQVIPHLQDRLRQGWKLKNDGKTFYKTAQVSFDVILRPLQFHHADVYINCGNVWLTLKHYYKVSDCGVAYYEQSYMLFDKDLNKYPDIKNAGKEYSQGLLEEADQRARAIQAQIRELRSELSNHSLLTGENY